MHWYKKKAADVLKELDSDENGLSDKEASDRIKKYGLNEIQKKKKTAAWMLFFNQFRNALVFILIVAFAISFAIGELIDAAFIFIIIILNALFGFFQERKAEKALEALKKMAAPHAEVMRGGKRKTIFAKEIVPGDILVLEAGSIVPADARIIEEMNLKADESLLTGESMAAVKFANPIKNDVSIPDRKNMLYAGTTVVYGHCLAIVTETGMKTEFGKIAAVLQEKEEETPLQKRLNRLGKHLGLIIIVTCAIIFAAGYMQGREIFELFLVAVSLAVAAIPEGLPAVVTITLAIGLLRMARKRAIVRRLPSVETLGSATVICSDKTGTLTMNQMTVRKVYINDSVIDVTGEGYETAGKFFLKGKELSESDDIFNDMKLLLGTGLMCNDATEANGDTTERALVVSAKKAGLPDIREKSKRVDEISFDSDRKMMSVLCDVNGRKIMYTKGAVEEVLKKCAGIYINGEIERLSESERKKILDANKKFAGDAMRVLAFAYKKTKNEKAERELIFVGLQAIIDPPRPEAKSSIELCKKAGIKSVMITGDNKYTAIAIAREIGMLDNEKNVLTGAEMDEMNDSDFERIVDGIDVYARVSPEHKVRITEALRKRGHIVAMSGDGINDAPALKKADIGIAVGSGTDVTKEVADMVLTDDNIATVVSAISEGRTIFDNIKRAILYLLACNFGEVLTIFVSIMLKMPLPILPLQILWMNIVTDGPPALGLSVEPAEPDVMEKKPRDPKEAILNKKSLSLILFVGILMAAATLLLFYFELSNPAKAVTISFTMLVVSQKFIAINMRSELPIYKKGFLANKKLLAAVSFTALLQVAIIYIPLFNEIFGTVPLSATDWAKILGASALIFVLLEIYKVVNKKRE